KMTAAPTWRSALRPSARPPRACRRIAGPDPDITSPADTDWRATRPRLRKTSKQIDLRLVVAVVVLTEIPVTQPPLAADTVCPRLFHSRQEGWPCSESTVRVTRHSSRSGPDSHRGACPRTRPRCLESL